MFLLVLFILFSNRLLLSDWEYLHAVVVYEQPRE